MNRALFISLLFLFACQANNDKTVAFLNEGIERCNREILILSDRYYTYAEMNMKLNPARNHPYKKNVDSLSFFSGNILLAIEQRKAAIDNKNISGQNTKTDLFKALLSYKNLIDSLFPNDSLIQQELKNKLSMKKSSVENYNSPELNLLINKIQNINNKALRYFDMKMGVPSFRSNKFEAAIIPKNKYLHFKEIYEASLYLLSYNTNASNISIKIGNQSLEIHNGKAVYTDTSTNKPGIIEKKGLLILKEPGSDFSLEYPFNLTYQIEDK